MSALAFISSLAQSLVWPAAVVVLVLIFRKPLSELIPRIRSIKAGPAEATFDSDELASAKIGLATMSGAGETTAAARLAGTWRTSTRSSSRSSESFALLDQAAARESPRDAEDATSITSRYRLQAMTVRGLAADAAPAVTVNSSWSSLEALLRELARLLGVPDTGSLTLLADEVITELDRRRGLLSADRSRSIFQTLLKLKLAVGRGAPVTKLEAIDYGEAALQLTDLLLTAYVTTQVQVALREDIEARGNDEFKRPAGEPE